MKKLLSTQIKERKINKHVGEKSDERKWKITKNVTKRKSGLPYSSKNGKIQPAKSQKTLIAVNAGGNVLKRLMKKLEGSFVLHTGTLNTNARNILFYIHYDQVVP